MALFKIKILLILMLSIGFITWICWLCEKRRKKIVGEKLKKLKEDDTYQTTKPSYNNNNTAKNTKAHKDTGRKQIYRRDGHHDNMNCDRYTFSGRYKETGRMRSKKTAYVFSGEDPKEVIKGLGYEEPIEYEYSPWDEMTKKQKEYLYDLTNGHYQNDMSTADASAMIQRCLDGVFEPGIPEMFGYAKEMRVPVSYYCSDYDLKSCILGSLIGRDSVAFYLYLVYCEVNNEQPQNLNRHLLRDKFYSSSEFEKENNIDFQDRIYHMDGIFNRRKMCYRLAKKYVSTFTESKKEQ